MINTNGIKPYIRRLLPTNYINTLSYEEQLLRLYDMLQGIEQYIEGIKEDLENYTEAEIEKMRIYVQEELIRAFDYADSIKFDLEALIGVTKNELIDYTNEQIRAEKIRIDSKLQLELQKIYDYINSKVIDVNVFNPWLGLTQTIQQFVDFLYERERNNALTSNEYDALLLSADAYDNYEVTAYEYDMNGKIILV